MCWGKVSSLNTKTNSLLAQVSTCAPNMNRLNIKSQRNKRPTCMPTTILKQFHSLLQPLLQNPLLLRPRIIYYILRPPIFAPPKSLFRLPIFAKQIIKEPVTKIAMPLN